MVRGMTSSREVQESKPALEESCSRFEMWSLDSRLAEGSAGSDAIFREDRPTSPC